MPVFIVFRVIEVPQANLDQRSAEAIRIQNATDAADAARQAAEGIGFSDKSVYVVPGGQITRLDLAYTRTVTAT